MVVPPLGTGRPIWVDDPDFDVARHVRLTSLPEPGTRRELLALAERLLAPVLDREHPLWEMWFVEGVDGGEHVGLIHRSHHTLTDGISGVDIATALLDFDAEPTVLDARRLDAGARRPTRSTSSSTRCARTLHPAQRPRGSARARLLDGADRDARRARVPARPVARLAASTAVVAPRLVASTRALGAGPSARDRARAARRRARRARRASAAR